MLINLCAQPQENSYLSVKLADMVGKQDKTPQLNIFDTPLKNFINLEHELCELSRRIDWESKLLRNYR